MISVVDNPITHYCAGLADSRLDPVSVEEPLEISLVYAAAGDSVRRSISVTMRTPGHDMELALGFLYAEGIIRSMEDVEDIRHCGPVAHKLNTQNVVTVALRDHVDIDLTKLERLFFTSSSCGLCGKTALQALELTHPPVINESDFVLAAETIAQLPAQLRAAQIDFDRTGGLHAAALFDRSGRLLDAKEDVGRHNALDKLIGARLRDGQLPATNCIALVSGRVSFELVQKSVMGGIPILVSLSASSSLAIEAAKRFNISLISFLRGDTFNVYHGAWRLSAAQR